MGRVGLLALGLVMVYSASVAMPDNPQFARYTPTFFLRATAWRSRSVWSLRSSRSRCRWRCGRSVRRGSSSAALLLLVLVLMPFIGKEVNGARRWIALGVLNFQPSELAKLAIALYAANYMVRKMEIKENFWRAVMPMAVALAVIGSLLLLPNPTWERSS